MFQFSPLRRSSSLLGVVIFGLVLAACSTPAQRASLEQPRVVEVIDVDTLIIDFGNRLETVRLLGVDTPETVDPNRPVQCFGAEASAFLRELVPPNTVVTVIRDIEARDRFGRLLVYLLRAEDELFVNAELLRGGFADIAIYDPNASYRGELEHAFATARTANAGLWESCGGPDIALDPPPVSVPVD